MALSPADFAAYSRATGTPYPEDPEERAALAPAVRDFRANQLRQPQEESPLAGILGAAALGLGALGAGTLGYRALRGRQAPAPVGKPRVPRESDLRAVSQAPLVRPSKVAAPETAIPQATVDLTSIQQNLIDEVRSQQVEASDAGLDQVISKGIVIPEQREVNNFVSFSRDADRIARTSQVAEQVSQFPQEVQRIAQTTPKRIVSGNVWELEEQLENLGRQAQEFYGPRYERTGRSVSDLTGELELTPQQARSLRGAKIGSVSTRSGLSAGRALDLSTVSESATARNRFTPEEILERTMAAASYPRAIRDQILNPEVPRERITEYLGTTPKIRGGAVSSNPTMEIAGGARASMPDALVEELETAGVGGTGLTYHDTTNLKQLQQKEKLEQAGFSYDPNTGNYYQEVDDYDYDPTEVMTANREMGTDYGDTEGVGNLLIETESFRERTNKGTTQIPGVVQEASAAAPGSERQLRAADVVVPLRRDPSGIQTAGINVLGQDPNLSFGQLLRMQDVGYKGGMGIETADINVGTNKLIGGFETAVDVVPAKITTQPISDWAPDIMYGETIPGTNIRQPYKPTSRRVIVGEGPLLGIRRTPLTQGEQRIGWTTLKTAKPEPVALDRATIQSVAERAQSDYFNNPSAKAAYLRENNPEALELGLAQGKTLSDIGEAYDYQGFIVKAVDDYLMNKEGIDVPILKPQISQASGKLYYPQEANAMVMSLLKTEKDTPIFGERIQVNKEGKKVVAGFNPYGYPIYKTTGKAAPIPGQYQVRGEGGIDPMTVGDQGADVDVAYYSPRISTAPLRTTGVAIEPSTVTGAQMSALRTQMETPQTGEGMKVVPVRNPQTGNVVGRTRVPTMNIGSFARTQNPYTGPAAPAMGPISRVSTGNYQYPESQLQVSMEPRSLSQGAQRNQFALAANLTPGGQVVRGKQELGLGLGSVPGGIGQLSESETIRRYGLSGSQLQNFGNRLMSQAAAKRRIR
jgi:hypothetical protein